MIPSWRRRKSGPLAGICRDSDAFPDVELKIPSHFRCPISLDLMKDPVILPTGITYDRSSIEKWIDSGNQTCPLTNQTLPLPDLIPNHSIRKMIQDWCVRNRAHGIERIPTPRIPVTNDDVLETCSRIGGASRRRDSGRCGELVGRIKAWGRESERNRWCVLESGAGLVLSDAFEEFSASSIEKNSALLEEILCVLAWAFPLGEEGRSRLRSEASLKCFLWMLKFGRLSARESAVLVLRELLSLHPDSLSETDGFSEELVRIVKEPISPTATKASLVIIRHIISSNERRIPVFVQLDLVSIILETLVESDKSTCEKGLAVLDLISCCDEGRAKALENALTVPLLVKKMLRVSALNTELSVSILWKLCGDGIGRDREGGVLAEAFQFGCLQKLLILLQVGLGVKMKEKVTGLLKLLSCYREGLDCSDASLDFNYIHRPY